METLAGNILHYTGWQNPINFSLHFRRYMNSSFIAFVMSRDTEGSEQPQVLFCYCDYHVKWGMSSHTKFIYIPTQHRLYLHCLGPSTQRKELFRTWRKVCKIISTQVYLYRYFLIWGLHNSKILQLYYCVTLSHQLQVPISSRLVGADCTSEWGFVAPFQFLPAIIPFSHLHVSVHSQSPNIRDKLRGQFSIPDQESGTF